MKKSSAKRLKEANGIAIERMLASRPVLIGVRLAREVIPGMHERLFLHSGPPIEWNRMCGPMRGAIIGAMLYEGLAQSESDATERLDKGEVKFAPTHHHRTVSPMAGIVSPSMPVFLVKNKAFGNEAYCTINEGVGRVKTLRFGANSQEVIERLHWMRETLAPALDQAIRVCGEIDLKRIIAEALRRGDECHNRNKSATAIFFRTITSPLLRTDLDKTAISSILDFVGGNDHFFLNLSMASSKVTMDTAHGVPSSTVVTVMTTNGVEFGIRVSGLGDQWFTAPAPHQMVGKLFEGYSREDANPVFGDSYISEPAGIGAFAMAASPAISEFVGSTPSFGIRLTKRMHKITLARHNEFRIPYLDYEGTPTGICLAKVVRTGIVPVVNTGVAHKKSGIGQIGAGIAKAPMRCFRKAARKFKEEYGIQL